MILFIDYDHYADGSKTQTRIKKIFSIITVITRPTGEDANREKKETSFNTQVRVQVIPDHTNPSQSWWMFSQIPSHNTGSYCYVK